MLSRTSQCGNNPLTRCKQTLCHHDDCPPRLPCWGSLNGHIWKVSIANHSTLRIQCNLLCYARAVVNAVRMKARKIGKQVINVDPQCYLSSPTSPSEATLRCSANQVGEQLSPAQMLHAQETWVVTANTLTISLAGGTPSNTIHAPAQVDKEAGASFL